MRRSFGGGSGGMGGGGGGSGGGMLRTLHRAVRPGGVGCGGAIHEPFSHATTNNTIRTTQTCKNKSNNTIKLSSSSSSSTTSSSNNLSPFSSYNHNIPISAASSTAPPWPTAASSPPCSVCDDDDDSEWEHLDGSEYERGHQHAYFDDVVFGAVPSRDEVQHAVCALQHVFEPTSFSFIKDTVAYHSDKEVGDQVCGPAGRVHTVSAVEPDSDWIEPSVQLCNSKALKPYGADRVYDAFHLLNTEPSVQRMVISLSSDKAIWNAVLNNEAVREFRESLNQGPAEKNFPEISDDDSAKDILSSIIVKIKAKVLELVDKIMKLLNEVFEPSEKTATAAGTADPLEEKLRASFLLSVMVLLIVVVTRANES